MSKTIEELSHSNGRVYVYFKTEAICCQFLIQAEQEGFTFGDGVKPTKRSHCLWQQNKIRWKPKIASY